MRFSYNLIKQLVPSLKNPQHAADLLNMHLFETEIDNDTLDVDVLPNRYSDTASHWGLARELSSILNKKANLPALPKFKVEIKKNFEVILKTPLCLRMSARYLEGLKIGPSPKWMQEVLVKCGMQPINNLVDITNYVTLETGQPLHAFDFDKMEGDSLVVRPAKKGEEVESLEGKKYKMDSDNLVLADKKEPLDIAGIKGGKKADITSKTKNILLTAGNFDSVSIYKTSRKINLLTDASLRFSHNISPELVETGIARAAELIKELCQAKEGTLIDIYQKKPRKIILKFDIHEFNKISGLSLTESQAFGYLKRLGFKIKGKLVEAPSIRTDIEFFEDLVEEVLRLYGYKKLSPKTPTIALMLSGDEDLVQFKDNVRHALTSFGLNEVYNYSFVSGKSAEGALEIENPISNQFSVLRPSLSSGLLKNIEDNFRFYDRVAVFEIGKTFKPNKKKGVEERLMLGMAIAHKKDATFFELKGLTEELFERLGLVDYFMREETPEKLRIETDHSVIGYLAYEKQNYGRTTIAEIDLEKLIQLVEGEKSYAPIPKYPSIMRDISIMIPQHTRFAEIMALIENSAPKYLDDADLIDYYENPKMARGFKSLTFRLVFLADSRTLTDKEVDKEVKKITSALEEELGAEIR